MNTMINYAKNISKVKSINPRRSGYGKFTVFTLFELVGFKFVTIE